MKKRFDLPYLGFGIGLRPVHFEDFLNRRPEVDWLEIISENFLAEGTRPRYVLDQIAAQYRIVPHGVSLSIGTADPLDWDYLRQLKSLVDRLDPPWVSDHLCWTRFDGHHMHNLMPLPYTPEVVRYVAQRARVVQDFIERPLLLENVSSYLEYTASVMPEWEFVAQITEAADCGILLDINNVYVSAQNHQFDAMTYLKGIPADRVIQYHIAGYEEKGTFLLDTHDHDVSAAVWDLYRSAIPMFGEVSLMLERDEHIPPLSELLSELDDAKAQHRQAAHVRA